MIRLTFLLIMFPFFLNAEMKIQEAAEQKFLLFKTQYKDTKEIGGHAVKQVPALKTAAEKAGLKIIGPVHHFYTVESGKGFLGIGFPVSGDVDYKGQFKIVTKPAYNYYSMTHKGPISGIGKSWDKFMTAFAQEGKMQEEGIEIYKTDLKNLMSDETEIEIRGAIADMSKFKNCIISGFAKGSQAKKAGLKKGDVILYYNGKPITNSAQMIQAVTKASNSKEDIKITVLRSGEEMEFTLKPGRLGAYLDNRK